MVSPRRMIRPSVLFCCAEGIGAVAESPSSSSASSSSSSISSPAPADFAFFPPFFPLRFNLLNSSVSAKTRFM